ncbi:MAG TPA: glycosyltransferase family 4 protein [Ignavibacteriaceae bacterium]|nr:glycosyltransferase family 4 protein [Ignavibacteriaceae bacterium]
MNILIVTTFYHPNEIGGTEVQTRILAEAPNSHHNLNVLTFDSLSDDTIEYVNNMKIRRIKLDKHQKFIKDRIARKHFGIKENLKLQFSLALKNEVLKKLDIIKNDIPTIDVIHFSGNFALFPIISMIKKLRNFYPKAKIVFTFHDFYMLGRRANYPNNKRFFFSSLRKTTLPKYVDYFTTPSSYLKNIVKDDFNLSENKVEVLNNFIPVKGEKDFNEESNIILYAGSFEYGKGVDILVKAFNKFSEKCKNYKLILIGEGYYKSEIENLLKVTNTNRYSILPKMTRNEVLDYMSKAKFIIAPSRYNETFGLSLVEGYFSGALPLGSKRGALPEVLNYDNDLLFENETDLVEKLTFFSQNITAAKEKYALLKLNMHKFTFENTEKKYLNFYQQINHK